MKGIIYRTVRTAPQFESDIWLVLLALASYLAWIFAKLGRRFRRNEVRTPTRGASLGTAVCFPAAARSSESLDKLLCAAADEQLVLYQQGWGHDNTYSARAHEFGNGGQQVDGEYEQVNYRHGR